MKAYVAAWVGVVLAAVVVAVRNRGTISLFGRRYLESILVPWKVVTALAGLAGIVLMAPLTGDPYWDWWDAGFMAVLAFATAPWAVGTVYRAVATRAGRPWTVFVAVAVWLFSASWSYDGYLLIRDGTYPVTWAWNLATSPVLYALAGLFWSLDWTPDGGVRFAFQTPDWPVRHDVPFIRVAIWCIPIAVIVALMFVLFGLNLVR